jgi:isopropylmalate/homocitrate/citramalate synthase
MARSDLVYEWNGEPPSAAVSVQDETLRDGVQAAGVRDPRTEDKRDFLHHMVAVGIESADIGLPSAGPRAYEDALALAREIAAARLPLTATCAARTLSVDIEPILDIAQASGVAIEVATFIGSSRVRQVVEGWTLADMVRATAASVSLALGAGHPVMFVTEDTTRAHPDMLRALYGEAIRCGARRVCVCDTVGHATPAGVARLLRFVRDEVVAPSRGGESVSIDWHGHRDRGLGLANAMAAIEAGADRVHATALGMGERAGNVEMELVLVNLALLGQVRGDLTRLPAYAAAASRAFGIPVPANYPAVGANAFRTGTGVHAAAIRKARAKGDAWLADRVYSGVPASLVGRTQEVQVSAFSGLANVRWWLETHGYDATDDARARRILASAKRSSSPLSDAELDALAAARARPDEAISLRGLDELGLAHRADIGVMPADVRDVAPIVRGADHSAHDRGGASDPRAEGSH